MHADLHPGNIMVRVRDDAPHLPFVAAFLQPIAALFAVDLVQRTTPVEISLIGATRSFRECVTWVRTLGQWRGACQTVRVGNGASCAVLIRALGVQTWA